MMARNIVKGQLKSKFLPTVKLAISNSTNINFSNLFSFNHNYLGSRERYVDSDINLRSAKTNKNIKIVILLKVEKSESNLKLKRQQCIPTIKNLDKHNVLTSWGPASRIIDKSSCTWFRSNLSQVLKRW